MRFKCSKKPKLGDTRRKTFFAFLPVLYTSNEESDEFRWLEWITAKQKYTELAHVDEWGNVYPINSWVNISFLRN